jgi:hypothetical protein
MPLSPKSKSRLVQLLGMLCAINPPFRNIRLDLAARDACPVMPLLDRLGL